MTKVQNRRQLPDHFSRQKKAYLRKQIGLTCYLNFFLISTTEQHARIIQ
jgi:hypothetical protein